MLIRSKPLLIHHTEVHKSHIRICLRAPRRQKLGWDVQPCPQDGWQEPGGSGSAQPVTPTCPWPWGSAGGSGPRARSWPCPSPSRRWGNHLQSSCTAPAWHWTPPGLLYPELGQEKQRFWVIVRDLELLAPLWPFCLCRACSRSDEIKLDGQGGFCPRPRSSLCA